MAPSGITAGLVAFCVAALLFSFTFLLVGTLFLFGILLFVFTSIFFRFTCTIFSQIIELITLGRRETLKRSNVGRVSLKGRKTLMGDIGLF